MAQPRSWRLSRRLWWSNKLLIGRKLFASLEVVSHAVTLLDVAASVGHGEVKVFGNHRDETIVKIEKTNFEKQKLRYSGYGILGT